MTNRATHAGRLDRDSAVPLWAQLLEDLRDRVERGEFEQRFPSELDLVAEYGVSRNTVRSVLARMRDEGVVLAGRGRKPRLNPEIRQPLGAFYSLYESIEAAGLEQRSVVRRFEARVNASVARRLNLPDETPLILLERVRFAGGEPLALDRAYFPERLASPILGVDLTVRSLYEVLAQRTGIRLTGGYEVLCAVVPTQAQQRELAIPARVALLAIERLGRVEDAPVEWRRTLVRADRFSVLSDFSVRERQTSRARALRLGPVRERRSARAARPIVTGEPPTGSSPRR